MQRSKQQALMFLLGAVLVGGALGFSADRYIAHDKFASSFGPRPKFYDALGLSQQQRNALDSLAFARECEIKAVLAPHDSAVKLIRARFSRQRDSILTPGQKTLLDQRREEARKRYELETAKEPKRTCTGN
jgi:hypothetical protein